MHSTIGVLCFRGSSTRGEVSLAMAPEGKRARSCCVVDCHKRRINTKGLVPGVRYYCFPKKCYEIKRRQAWIAAVRRANADGGAWVPSENSRICSRHFVGNCKSDSSMDPSYVPTIFPPVCYKKRAPTDPQAAQRRQWHCTKAAGLGPLEQVALQNAPQVAPAAKDQATCMCPSCTLQRDPKLPAKMPPIAMRVGGRHVSSVPFKTSRQAHSLTQTDAACQAGMELRGSLIVFMSATTGAEASTQVAHTEHCNKKL